MSALYVAAVALCVGVAAWLQVSVEMHRGYRWLSWGTAVVFAAGLIPTLLAQPGLETLSQLILFASAPLIVIPFQVRMIRMISGREDGASVGSAGGSGHSRGPGGGRLRNRDRRRR